MIAIIKMFFGEIAFITAQNCFKSMVYDYIFKLTHNDFPVFLLIRYFITNSKFRIGCPAHDKNNQTGNIFLANFLCFVLVPISIAITKSIYENKHYIFLYKLDAGEGGDDGLYYMVLVIKLINI